jgi:threonine dehydratase
MISRITAMTAFDVTLSDIENAQERIKGRVRVTPTYTSASLSARLGVETLVKLECLQNAGSFKVRGCFNKLLTLTPHEQARGVVTVSGGNHAIAVSQVATSLGMKALVLMPKTTPALNIALTQGAGGTVELCDDAIIAFAKAADHAAQGMVNIHSFDDPLIIAGHGTMGLELASQARQGNDGQGLTHVFISIGGGGFSAGVGAALKALDPAVKIYGVETAGAENMTLALAAGKPVNHRSTSIARTLGAPFATERTMAAARDFLEEIIIVPDRDAVAGILDILEAERVLVEPAAACVLAAALARRDTFRPGDRVALVLCGSNVALADVLGWKTQFGL